MQTQRLVKHVPEVATKKMKMSKVDAPLTWISAGLVWRRGFFRANALCLFWALWIFSEPNADQFLLVPWSTVLPRSSLRLWATVLEYALSLDPISGTVKALVSLLSRMGSYFTSPRWRDFDFPLFSRSLRAKSTSSNGGMPDMSLSCICHESVG
jgi:hypothetical protein